MKLEKITIEGEQFYQWIILGTAPDFKNSVGDIFKSSHDIQQEKEKMALEWNYKPNTN